jgi:hypothetical protein
MYTDKFHPSVKQYFITSSSTIQNMELDLYDDLATSSALAKVIVLQCTETRRLSETRLQSHLAIGKSLIDVSVLALGNQQEQFEDAAKHFALDAVASNKELVIITDSHRALEISMAVVQVLRLLQLQCKCSVIFVDNTTDLDAPHRVQECDVNENISIKLYCIGGRPFAPQDDASPEQDSFYFADCGTAYSAVAKLVFHLDIFQKPYCWFILRQALYSPKSIAVEDGISGNRREEKALTYMQFVSAAISLAECLQQKPFCVEHGGHVAILLDKGVDWLTTILACNLIGAVFTIFDTRLNDTQAKHVWKTFEPTLVICRNKIAVAEFVCAHANADAGELFHKVNIFEFTGANVSALDETPSRIDAWMGRCK